MKMIFHLSVSMLGTVGYISVFQEGSMCVCVYVFFSHHFLFCFVFCFWEDFKITGNLKSEYKTMHICIYFI